MKRLLFYMLLLSCLSLNAQQFIPRWQRNEVDIALEKLISDPDLSTASVSFLCMDTAGNKIIAQHNPTQTLVPASVMKVVTTSTALEILGAKKHFTTDLEYDGYIDSFCVLHGNLYIKGGGDPTLGSAVFPDKKGSFSLMESWANIIAQSGIDSIDGRVAGDAEIFSPFAVNATWIWGDIGQYYGAGSYGLNYKDNSLLLELRSGKENGDFTLVTCTYPYLPDLSIDNRVISSDLIKDEAYMYGTPYDGRRMLVGSIPTNRDRFFVKTALPDPPYTAALELESELYAWGIAQRYPASTVRRLKESNQYLDLPRNRIYRRWSPSVAQIVDMCNTYSNNLFAETLLNQIALNRYGHGETMSGALAVENFWRQKAVGMEGMYIYDGSGLSRFNAVSSNHIVRILRYMMDRPSFNVFYNSLPVAGRTGTLKHMLKNTLAENNMHAKSGTMNRVKSYAGYVTTADGHVLVFAIIANNFTCSLTDMRRKMELLFETMANYRPGADEQSENPFRSK